MEGKPKGKPKSKPEGKSENKTSGKIKDKVKGKVKDKPKVEPRIEATASELPAWLYCALTRKQMSDVIAHRVLKSGKKNPIKLTKTREQLRSFRKPRAILVRVAAQAAVQSGAHFEITKGGFLVDKVSLEYLSCSKLTGHYEKLQRIDGAGGVVLRDKQEQTILLLLKREGKNLDWVLPKGKRERGETRRQTALREVEEETGITSLKVKKFLSREGYFVITKQQVIYKHVSYYLMYSLDPSGTLNVKEKEGFIDGQWVKLDQALLLTNPTRAHITLGRLNSEIPKKRRDKRVKA